MNEYEKQAVEFLNETGTTLKLEFVGLVTHFEDDEKPRNVWRFTLSNSKGFYRSTFGDSIVNTYIQENEKPRYSWQAGQPRRIKRKPANYDILACLGFYYPEEYGEFCEDFGYSQYNEDRSVNGDSFKIYQACMNEQRGLRKIFNSEQLEKLGEIN